MPLAGFRSTAPGDEHLVIEFANAPEYFERKNIMPHDAVLAIIESIHDIHAEMSPRYVTPSGMCPSTTCRREALIKAHWDYTDTPQAYWTMEEGTVFHAAFQAAAKRQGKDPRVLREALLPDKNMAGVGKICEDGMRRVEIIDGVWTCGIVDHLSADRQVLTDYKTTKFPKVSYKNRGEVKVRNFTPGNAAEWAYQISPYGFIVRACFGVDLKEAHVWRMYKGSHLPNETWFKQPIELLTQAQFDANAGSWLREFVGWKEEMIEAKSEAEREAILARVPLDGDVQQMFGGTKCTKYCPVSGICADQNGDLEF